MNYASEIRARHDDPKSLEQLYQASLRTGESDEFSAAVHACYKESPDTVLYAAWHHRFEQASPESVEGRRVNWRLAVPLSVGLGLVFWILSDPRFDLRTLAIPLFFR